VKEGQLYLKAGLIGERSGTMYDVEIYDLTDPARRRTLIADSGTLALAANRKDLWLTLYDGVMLSVPTTDPGQLSRVYYRRNRLIVKDVAKEFEQTDPIDASKSDREMGVCEMQRAFARSDGEYQDKKIELVDAEWLVKRATGEAGNAVQPPAKPFVRARGIGYYYCKITVRIDSLYRRIRKAPAVKTAATAFLPASLSAQAGPGGRGSRGLVPVPQSTPPATVPGKNLEPQVDPGIDASAARARVEAAKIDLEGTRYRRDRYGIEIQKKFSLAAACIVLALVGAPIALRFPRGGVGLVIGASFGIFAIYYVCLIAGESLANRGYLAPWIAMWLANIIFLVIGLTLYARMGHETGTTRGGNAGEFWERISGGTARLFGRGRSHDTFGEAGGRSA
jgi:lipopolysaccharide export system permease protein